MCGGGGKRATIREPDYKAMNRVAGLQFEAMRNAQSSQVALAQNQLNESLSRQNQVTQELRDQKVADAQRISAEEARIAALIGTPPPEESAKAPVLGENRTSVARGRRGRAAMRTAPLQLPTTGA